MNKLKQKILFFQNKNNDNSETVLDYIFETIDRLCETNKFDIVEDLLNQPVKGYSTDSLVALLTITAIYHTNIRNRPSFYGRTYRYLKEIGCKDIDAVLMGLS